MQLQFVEYALSLILVYYKLGLLFESLPSLQNEFKQPGRLFKPILQSEHTFLAPSDFILVISPCLQVSDVKLVSAKLLLPIDMMATIAKIRP